MKRCFPCLSHLCYKKKTSKITQEPDASSKQLNGATASIRYDRNNMSITIQSEEPIVHSINGVLIHTVSHLSPSPVDAKTKPKLKLKPKVYRIMQGKASICRTPSVEPPNSALLKTSKISKGSLRVPRSALLPPDIEAKKELMRLQIVHSYTEERPRTIDSEA